MSEVQPEWTRKPSVADFMETSSAEGIDEVEETQEVENVPAARRGSRRRSFVFRIRFH
jgi:hypothetical protein